MTKVEELTAACMKENGFEYTPIVEAVSTTKPRGSASGLQPGTLKFAQQYGYGLSTDPYGYGDSAATGGAGSTPGDPNADRVAAMSAAQQLAYTSALHGTQGSTESKASDAVKYDWKKAGCQGKAQHAVYDTGKPAPAGNEFAGLMQEMTAMQQAVAADPALAEVTVKWASCMADAGLPGFASVDDPPKAFSAEIGALQGGAPGGPVPGAKTAAADAAQTAADLKTEMTKITPREIKTAVADVKCRESVGYAKVAQDVNFTLQQQFLDTHKTDLDAWLASPASGSAG